MGSLDVSFIIPCYASERTVLDVVREIEQRMLDRPAMTYEIVCIVDGSPDNVFSVLAEYAKLNQWVKVAELGRNYGRASAVMAGYHIACGRIAVVLDDDGQCPLDRIWDLIAPIEQGLDVCAAHYIETQKSLFRKFGSYLNGWIEEHVIGLPKGFKMTNFCAVSHYVLTALKDYKTPFPYFSGYIIHVTNRLTTVDMSERKRSQGESGFTFSKMINLWVSGLTGSSVKPLRAAYFFCGALFFAAVFFGMLLICFPDSGFQVDVIVKFVIMFGIAAALLSLGLLGEYVGRSLLIMSSFPQYRIRSAVNLEKRGDYND